jgi:hypothetical protein
MRGARIVLLLSLLPTVARAETFGADLAFLRKHTEVVVLGAGKAQVALVPAWQGRVATSTAAGEAGASFGWINRALIAAGKIQPHINVYGGEERLWIGPEGGQFSVFFKKGDPFDLEHWQTPPPIDTEPFPMTAHDERKASFARTFKLTNYAGTVFDLRVERTVTLLDGDGVKAACGQAPAKGLSWVGYQSDNVLSNAGKSPWTKKTGLPSLWMLGMFTPSPATTVVIPHRVGAAERFVNDSYFGAVPADRLVVTAKAVFYRGDGQQRGKIGLRPEHARATLGSYDAQSKMLTVLWYSKPEGTHPYVDSTWRIQKDPFAGDVVNSYNDGPPTPGAKALGPFYELESSSPAAELAPGGSLTHVQRTMHFQGPRAALDGMARACLGLPLGEIEAAFKR